MPWELIDNLTGPAGDPGDPGDPGPPGTPSLVVANADPQLTTPGLWIQTGLGPSATGMTFWIEDGA